MTEAEVKELQRALAIGDERIERAEQRGARPPLLVERGQQLAMHQPLAGETVTGQAI